MAVLLVFSSLPGLRGSELELSTSLEVLRGLPIRQFFDASYRLILLRDPENVTSAGLADEFGVRNDYLTDVSPEYILETYTLYRDVLDLLHAYDRDALSDADRLSYDIYEWYLDDWVRGEPYAFHQYPVISLGLSGWSTDVTVVTLFTTDQPLSTRGDLEGYIARLSRVSAKMEQLVAALRYREERGIVIPRFMVEGVIERLKSYLGIPGETPASPAAIAVEDTVLWPSFNERLGLVGGLSAQEKRDSLAAVRQGIAESFIPGFYALLRHMEDSLPQAPEIGGGDGPSGRRGVLRLPPPRPNDARDHAR